MARQDTELERSYRKHSKNYDQKRFEGKANKYREFVRTDAFLSLLPKDKNLKILDVGCGTGRGALMLGQKTHFVGGIDFTKEMLDIAEDKRKRLGLNNIKFIQGNAKKLPFKDSSFDCVVCLNFIHMF